MQANIAALEARIASLDAQLQKQADSEKLASLERLAAKMKWLKDKDSPEAKKWLKGIQQADTALVKALRKGQKTLAQQRKAFLKNIEAEITKVLEDFGKKTGTTVKAKKAAKDIIDGWRYNEPEPPYWEDIDIDLDTDLADDSARYFSQAVDTDWGTSG